MPENKDALLETLPPDLREDAEKVYQEIGQTMPDHDLRDFVAELHRRGMLTQDQLRVSVLALESNRRIEKVLTRLPEGERDSHQILGPLGAGAMGEVLLAKDELGRVVAIKRLLPAVMSKKAIIRRFFKEAQITAQLDHPAIVPIHGLVKNADGQLAYSMKLVRGVTLEEFFDETADQYLRGGRPDNDHSMQARLDIFLHVCEAIAYANDRGVVHRDLKPENIMVGAFGQVIVMDWGIAKLVARPDSKETVEAEAIQQPKSIKGTRVGMLMGTPRYMSPEQAEGKNDVLDARSDQYALGIILQELVTLQPAVKADLDLQGCLTWAKAAKRMPFTVLHRAQPMPKQLVAIVEKACKLDPGKRYRNVGAMAADIRRHLRNEPILAMPDSIPDRVNRWMGKNSRKVLLLLMFVVMLGVMGVATTGVIGMASLGASQMAAQEKEERLARILNATTEQAITLEAAFLHWNGQLNGIGYAVEQALTGGNFNERIKIPGPYGPLIGLEPNDRYKQVVSMNWPDLATATVWDKKLENDVLKQLTSLGPQFRSTLADSAGVLSSGRPGAQRNAINGGVPITWVAVYTPNGFRARYPGQHRMKRNVDDFTKAPWFKNRQHDREIRWQLPRVDTEGQGLVTSAYRTLTAGHSGDFAGVARIDVSLQHIYDTFLTPPPWASAAFLVNEDADVVLTSRENPRDLTKYQPEVLPIPEIQSRIATEAFGTLEVEGGLATWARLNSTGWTFVLLVEPGEGPSEK